MTNCSSISLHSIVEDLFLFTNAIIILLFHIPSAAKYAIINVSNFVFFFVLIRVDRYGCEIVGTLLVPFVLNIWLAIKHRVSFLIDLYID